VEALLDLLDGRVGHYVYVSSIMAYDQTMAGIFPWTEELPTDPAGPATYGGFKAVAEAAMLARHARTGFPATVVRPAAIYGPDNNIFDMELPMFLRLLQHRPIIVPHGGLVVGSYGHVDDLCTAMVDIVGNAAAVGEVFNISAGSTSVNRYVEVLADVVGEAPDVVYLPDSMLDALPGPVFGHLFGVAHHAMLSIEKAQRLLGLDNRYDLRSGHVDTLEWFRRRGFADVDSPLIDPMWRASWDFDAEAAVAAEVRRG